jgi:hypothetical protein
MELPEMKKEGVPLSILLTIPPNSTTTSTIDVGKYKRQA